LIPLENMPFFFFIKSSITVFHNFSQYLREYYVHVSYVCVKHLWVRSRESL
jgi:hypothetical protein